MFCNQCSEAIGNKGCTKVGACGKPHNESALQDLIVYYTRIVGEIITENNIKSESVKELNRTMMNSLFITITNANFDEKVLVEETEKLSNIIKKLLKDNNTTNNHFEEVQKITDLNERAELVEKIRHTNEDVQSLRELIIYGLKGLAAYTSHAFNLNEENMAIYDHVYSALAMTLNDNASVDDLVAMTLETGKFGVESMAVLDKANNKAFGTPEMTKVNIGVRNNPAILISGHDLNDIVQLLEQTKGTGVDVYTHSEMLPAHYYPELKKYEHLAGNYGNAWWKQTTEFKSFNGPILFTTNCIVPFVDDEIKSRIFTTGSCGLAGSTHIEEVNGKKDFTEIIEMAKTLPAPTEIESGEIVGGFAHAQVLALADKVVEAIKAGDIKKFVVMAGCDGRYDSREYYTEFAKALPEDNVILTAGCAKFRYNKLDLGDIGGIPRILDAGQCNDSYSLALVALTLKDVFGLDDINELPIVYNIAWYEQKAVIVLLALLHLGVKNIKLGPVLPAFLSPNVANVLVDTFGISGIGSVEEDINTMIK